MSNIVTNLPTKFSRTELFRRSVLRPRLSAADPNYNFGQWYWKHLGVYWSGGSNPPSPGCHGFWPSLSAQERARGSRALGLLPSVQFPPFKHFQISPSKTNNWYNTRWRGRRRAFVKIRALVCGSIIRKRHKQKLLAFIRSGDIRPPPVTRVPPPVNRCLKFDWSNRTLPGVFCLLIGLILVSASKPPTSAIGRLILIIILILIK